MPDWHFPPPTEDSDLVALGADLEPDTLVAAYRAGYFPMPLDADGTSVLGWFSPTARGVLRPERMHRSRSLRRSVRRFRVTVDADFEAVMLGCGDPARPHGWIDDDILGAYGRLHELGFAHSFEVWDDDGLQGGLYGLSIGALFCAESKFHRATDASKVAVAALCSVLATDTPGAVVDTQWATAHLRTLGVEEWTRDHYLDTIAELVDRGGPDFERWRDHPDRLAETVGAAGTSATS